MDSQIEERIVSRVTQHFDSQVNWLNTNFEGHVNSVMQKIDISLTNHKKEDDRRFTAVYDFIKKKVEPLLEIRTMREIRVICISVLVALTAVGAVWAMN